jgi:hypothetical protein
MFVSSLHIFGYIKFDLNNKYVELLKAYIEYVFENNTLSLLDNTLQINTYEKDFELLVDVLMFIKKNGNIISSDILCSVGAKNIKHILFEKGEFVVKSYQTKREDRISRFYSYIINKIKIKRILKYDLKKEKRGVPDGVLFELNSVIKSFVFNPEPSLFSLIENYLKNSGLILEFYFDDELIILNDSFQCLYVPYVKMQNDYYLVPTYTFLSKYNYDINEKRKIKIGNNIVPLWEPFMKLSMLENEENKNVILSSGQSVETCHECIFRLRRLTTGCSSCNPKIKPLE